MKYESIENVEIGSPQREDMKGVQEVFYKTWLATYPNEELGITVEDIEERFKGKSTEGFFQKRWERLQNDTDTHMLCAKDNGQVIGVAVAVRQPDTNQLQAIYLLPEYQGKGIGKLLWDAAQQYFNPTYDTIVHVAPYNTPAINFYKKLGFKETGRVWEDEKFRMKSGAIIPNMEMVIKAEKINNE